MPYGVRGRQSGFKDQANDLYEPAMMPSGPNLLRLFVKRSDLSLPAELLLTVYAFNYFM